MRFLGDQVEVRRQRDREVFSNLSDRLYDWDPIKIGEDVFWYTMNVMPKGTLFPKVVVSSKVQMDRLVNTLWKEAQGLVIYSITFIFLFSFWFQKVYGKIMDKDLSIKFAVMVQDASVWEKTMDKAFHNRDSLDALYGTIEEEEYLFFVQ